MNGVPIPTGASCLVVANDVGVVSAELWFWRDAGSATWYNYAVDGVAFDPSTALAMCGSYYGLEPGGRFASTCTPDSADLIFTAPNVFVVLRLAADVDLSFCETLSIVSPATDSATACGTVAEDDGGTPTSSPTPPVEGLPYEGVDPSKSEQPSASPVTPPAASPTTSAPGGDDGSDASAGSGPSETTSDDPTGSQGGDQSAGSTGSSSEPGSTATIRHPDDEIVVLDTPDDSAVVATVSGARFPIGLVVTLAGLLGLFGLMVLLIPSRRELRRRPLG